VSGIKSFLQALHDCLAALILLFLTASGVTAQANTTDKDVPVQIRLTPDKNTIMLGEPLFLSFEVTNLSGEKLGVRVGGDYRNRFGRPDSFMVSVVGADGKALPQLEVIGMGGLVGWEPIEPGATYTFRLFLSHWAVIERAGSYRVHVTRKMSFASYAPNRVPKGDYSMVADVNAEITVVPADENKMGGVINSLGSVMLDVSDPRAGDSAIALASIQDKRTITYFAEAVRRFRAFGTQKYPHVEYTVAARSIAALATYDDDRAIEALRGAMDSPSEDIRWHVANAFGDSRHKSALKLLLKMQDDYFWMVRVCVAIGLKTVKTKEAQAVLQKLAKDGVKEVRDAANHSLN
jgi:hypothetical protein